MTSIRNQIVWSVCGGAIISAAIVLAGGILLGDFFAARVNPLDTSVTVDMWRERYFWAIYACAGGVAVLTSFWLLTAHRGSGLGSMSGIWHIVLVLAASVAGFLVGWLPPSLREGFGLAVSCVSLITVLAYWLATLLMTPEHYKYTPWLGFQLYGKKAS